jgi:ribose/xylose/arabinose/galactoside ABC-type transport system permease subunit
MILRFSGRRLALFVVEHLIWFINLGLIIFFGIMNFMLFSTGTLMMILYSVSALGFLVYAEGIALISGHMDLSVGGIAAFTSVIIGKLALQWAPQIPALILIPLYAVIGGLLGIVNGYCIGKLRINSFLQTLSAYLVLYGVNVVISPGTLHRLPELIVAAGSSTIPSTQLPLAVVILILGAVIIHIILVKTRFGRRIYAVGGSKEASRACGISVEKTIIATFACVGVLSGIAGLIYTGYQLCVTTYMARDDVFRAFTGPIIGGVALAGGRGKMVGIFGGITMIGIIDTGLTLLGYPAAWRTALNGVILGIAIFVNTAREKIRWRLLAKAD